MSGTVTQAVFPVAGLGTRFLPATKASPKEMLPIVDKPIIQFAVEEAVEAGITTLVFVTGRTKRSIEDHFDRNLEMEWELAQRGKDDVVEEVRGILPSGVHCIYIRQPEPLGLGHAVLCAQPAIGNNPFAVILPDDLVRSDGPGCMQQMVRAYGQVGASVLAVQPIALELSERYGIVSTISDSGPLSEIQDIVEKPPAAQAPSNLAAIGRYLLTPTIFELLRTQPRGTGGEIQLTDAIARLLHRERAYALRFNGRRFDCGSKIGFLEATVHVALSRADLRCEFRRILREIES